MNFTNSLYEVSQYIASPTDTRPPELPSVQIPQAGTQAGGGRPTDQPGLSPEPESPRTRRPRERSLFSTHARYASPEPRFVCDGWCEYHDDPHPNVVCIVHSFRASGNFMILGSSLCLPARTYKARGKAQTAH